MKRHQTIPFHRVYLFNCSERTLCEWNNSDYSHDLSNISKIELNFPDDKGIGFQGSGQGAYLEDRLVDVSWSYRGLTVTDISLNRPMGDYYNNNKEEEFGFSVAMSGDGKTIAVGAPYFSANWDGTANNVRTNCGRVLIYKWRNSRWETSASQLWGSYSVWNNNEDGSQTEIVGKYDLFGYSVALNDNGNVLVVGAPQDNSNTVTSYKYGYIDVYGFEEQYNTYTQICRIGPDTFTDGLMFGFSVDITPDGKYISVGVPYTLFGNGDFSTGLARILRYQTVEQDSSAGQYGYYIRYGSDIIH